MTGRTPDFLSETNWHLMSLVSGSTLTCTPNTSDANDTVKIEYSLTETILAAMMAVAVSLPLPWI